ncbi:MAG: HPr(Ser) kinase/phosphatase [Chlamydiales bacterium]|nr:HPr(Ser) kinase/phosphatase [Chlamydiales bacterium]
MFSVNNLIEKYVQTLSLEIIAGKKGADKSIKLPETERPGLILSGYLKGYTQKRILVFGKIEMDYLRHLPKEERYIRLKNILSHKVPAIVVTRKMNPLEEMKSICEEESIPLLKTTMPTMNFISKLTGILSEECSSTISCHGTLVEAFGIGVLIQGDSSVGKSETALGMIERGHRLISDDIVLIRKKESAYLEGTGPELTRHLLEIRGIGIINVAHLYGAVCISEKKRVDIIVKLEIWDDTHFYDRIGLEDRYEEMLGLKIPHYVMPVKPGRDVVLLLETIVLNHRLKKMGYNSAKEFNVKLLETISKRQKQVLMESNLKEV